LIGEGHAATLIKGMATNFLSEVQPVPSIEPVQAWGYKNTSLVAQTFVYAAESHDLATCLMEGFDARCERQTQTFDRDPDP
jgi:nitroreductase